jgi:hypothetical protein
MRAYEKILLAGLGVPEMYFEDGVRSEHIAGLHAEGFKCAMENKSPYDN